jgi:hypothetical protein
MWSKLLIRLSWWTQQVHLSWNVRTFLPDQTAPCSKRQSWVPFTSGGTENPSLFDDDSTAECSTPLDLLAGDKYGAEITALPVHHMVFSVCLPVNERGFPPQPGAVSRLHKQDQIFPGTAALTPSERGCGLAMGRFKFQDVTERSRMTRE